jgi:hypothetical protein
MLWITDTFRIRCVLVLDTVTTLKLITLIYIIFLNYYQCRRVNRIENLTGCSSLMYINNLNKIMFCSFKLDLYLHWSFKKKKFSQIAHLCYILFTLLTFFSYAPFTMLFFMLYFVNVWTITFIPTTRDEQYLEWPFITFYTRYEFIHCFEFRSSNHCSWM